MPTGSLIIAFPEVTVVKRSNTFAMPSQVITKLLYLNRRLENLSKEASSELDKLCGNELWKSIGFEAFDGLDDAGLRASANYYYGQFQTARELQDIFS